jgi:hypothetical protein
MSKRNPRSFELVVVPDQRSGSGDSYAVELHEVSNGQPKVVAALEDRQLDRLKSSVMSAVTGSKQPRSSLSASRRAPIPLSEDAGVRLGLAALAARPVSKPARVEAIRIGVETMTSEEALYWYAHATGSKQNRALKALRILLSDE